MIRLIEPCETYLSSYTEACDEYMRMGDACPFTDPRTCDLLAKFDKYRHERNLPANRVGSSYYWLVDDEQQRFLGEISIRHRLNDTLRRYGGHIGYGVRRSEWNKGYGTLMLSLALPHAKALGIDRALITCDDDNPGSARVMEKNGFILGDKVDNIVKGKAVLTRRYWKTL